MTVESEFDTAEVRETIASAFEYGTSHDIAEAGPGGNRVDLTSDDIAAVVHGWAVSPEGFGSVQLYAIVRLVDGRYAAVMAWADTTGWGCQDELTIRVGATERDAILALDNEGRSRLGLEIDTRPGAR